MTDRLKFLTLDEGLYRYAMDCQDTLHPELLELASMTASRSDAVMQISHDQAVFMHQLVSLMGATRCLEIGTFTGYSAIAVALAPTCQKLVTIDVDAETSALARQFFDRCGVGNKIDQRLGSALEVLPGVVEEFGREAFDFAFVDADKVNLQSYLDFCLELVRPGGAILIDNVLWGGSVIDDGDQSASTAAIRAFNRQVKSDSRVSGGILTVADGIYLLRKS